MSVSRGLLSPEKQQATGESSGSHGLRQRLSAPIGLTYKALFKAQRAVWNVRLLCGCLIININLEGITNVVFFLPASACFRYHGEALSSPIGCLSEWPRIPEGAIRAKQARSFTQLWQKGTALIRLSHANTAYGAASTSRARVQSH